MNTPLNSRTQLLKPTQTIRIKWQSHGWYNVKVDEILAKDQQKATVIVTGTEHGKPFRSDSITLFSDRLRNPVWSNSSVPFPVYSISSL